MVYCKGCSAHCITASQFREGHRARWPFADVSSQHGEVPDLSALVNKIIRVFSHVGPVDLKVGLLLM